MAKCTLSIELAEPDAIHAGGGKISGVVRVAVDADVHCNGLEVQSVWRTHGRGNVSSGTGDSATLYSGPWRAGENREYPFELTVADWPPTYHGHYLNVDHYIDARAKLPWSVDPKASVPFRMRPTCGAEAATVPSKVVEAKGILGCILGAVVLAIFLGIAIGFAMAGPFALIFLLFPLIGLLVWFVRSFLPRWVLGEVEGTFSAVSLRPGETTAGQLTIRPKKNVKINEISLLLQGREECVSGSGSNRTTHKHVLMEDSKILQEATTLSAGVEHRFPCSVRIPEDSAYSLDLDDNKLIWNITLRVDIPNWPDWVKEFPLTIVPSAEAPSKLPERSSPQFGGHQRSAAHDDQAAIPVTATVDDQVDEPDGSDGVSFAETVTHLWKARERRDQVDLLVEAVSGLTFEIEAVVERRLLYSGDDDPHVYRDGYAVWAHFPEPPLPMVLYVPHRLADDFEQVGRDLWRGRGQVVGWDRQHGRLQIRLQ
jgi:hypothetical protein